ncbi:MAG: hypothetical protein ACPGSI_00905 [Pikeienuella sp.]
MFMLTWVAGFMASVGAIFITRAERRHWGTIGVGFDKPLRRILAFGLAGVSLGLLLFYATLGSGLVAPSAVLAVISVGLYAIPAERIAAWGMFALILSLCAFACVIAAFQQIYGDHFFGFDDPFAR